MVTGESLQTNAANATMVGRRREHRDKPFGVANWTVSDASGNFCSRGGRFGTHSSNESFAPVYYKRIVFFAHFNAGVRAVDIRNPTGDRELHPR